MNRRVLAALGLGSVLVLVAACGKSEKVESGSDPAAAEMLRRGLIGKKFAPDGSTDGVVQEQVLAAIRGQVTPAPGGVDSSTMPAVIPTPANGVPAVAGNTGGRPLAGVWNGALNCGAEGMVQLNFKVAASGNPVFQYQTKTGARETELTHTGQAIQWVPAGGGVATVVVETLTVTDSRISYTLRTANERTSQNTLSQAKGQSSVDAKLSGALLNMDLQERSQEILSQPGIVAPPSTHSSACKGPMKR